MRPTAALHHTKVDGLDAFRMENAALALAIVPALGAKMSSLLDKRTGREWLWTSPRIPRRPSPVGTSYLRDGDSGGWDECFPTVAPCAYPLSPWAGSPLPDHGELWAQPWEARPLEEPDCVGLSTTASGIVLPYLFERTVRLSRAGARISLDYRLTSLASADLAFIWSAHPLLRIEPGMRLRLPPQAAFNVYGAPLGFQLPATTGLSWPLPASNREGSLSLDPLPGPEAALAVKLWSEPLPDTWAELEGPDGSLRFSLASPGVSRVALWLNLGGWAGDGGRPYYNLGLEPCIGAQDSLEQAAKSGAHQVLPGGATLAWHLDLDVAASASG